MSAIDELGSSRASAEYVLTHAALSEVGNAERLVALHGDDLRYAPGIGWLAWDGRRWAIDDTGEVMRRAQRTLVATRHAAAEVEDRDRGEQLFRYTLKSEKRTQLESMVKLAQVNLHVVVRASDLDADPMLLNVKNGTLDLRTGELRPHRREDKLTKLANARFDPDAEAPVWIAFLERVLPDDAVRAFVQRGAGYSLTANIDEQVMFLAHGAGANGKSTFHEALQDVLGDYAGTVAASTLLAERDRGATNDLARLPGIRMALASESGEDRRLDEDRVKSLTGGDPVLARFLYREFFQFVPVLKLWLATNHLPEIRGTDYAIWRRINLVPFDVTIPKDDRDGKLPRKLAAERDGILTWAVEGCAEWQRGGLRAPKAVQRATASYQENQDTFGMFLADRCVDDPDGEVRSSELFGAYKRWCETAGEKPWSSKKVGLRLAERGFEAGHDASKKHRIWRGLRFASSAPNGGQARAPSDASDASDPRGVNPSREPPRGEVYEKGSNASDASKEQRQAALLRADRGGAP